MGLVTTWLKTAGLGHAVPAFKVAGIHTPSDLAQLEMQDYELLGVTDWNDKRKLLYLIQRVQVATQEQQRRNDENGVHDRSRDNDVDGDGEAEADGDVTGTEDEEPPTKTPVRRQRTLRSSQPRGGGGERGRRSHSRSRSPRTPSESAAKAMAEWTTAVGKDDDDDDLVVSSPEAPQFHRRRRQASRERRRVNHDRLNTDFLYDNEDDEDFEDDNASDDEIDVYQEEEEEERYHRYRERNSKEPRPKGKSRQSYGRLKLLEARSSRHPRNKDEDLKQEPHFDEEEVMESDAYAEAEKEFNRRPYSSSYDDHYNDDDGPYHHNDELEQNSYNRRHPHQPSYLDEPKARNHYNQHQEQYHQEDPYAKPRSSRSRKSTTAVPRQPHPQRSEREDSHAKPKKGHRKTQSLNLDSFLGVVDKVNQEPEEQSRSSRRSRKSQDFDERSHTSAKSLGMHSQHSDTRRRGQGRSRNQKNNNDNNYRVTGSNDVSSTRSHAGSEPGRSRQYNDHDINILLGDALRHMDTSHSSGSRPTSSKSQDGSGQRQRMTERLKERNRNKLLQLTRDRERESSRQSHGVKEEWFRGHGEDDEDYDFVHQQVNEDEDEGSLLRESPIRRDRDSGQFMHTPHRHKKDNPRRSKLSIQNENATNNNTKSRRASARLEPSPIVTSRMRESIIHNQNLHRQQQQQPRPSTSTSKSSHKTSSTYFRGDRIFGDEEEEEEAYLDVDIDQVMGDESNDKNNNNDYHPQRVINTDLFPPEAEDLDDASLSLLDTPKSTSTQKSDSSTPSSSSKKKKPVRRRVQSKIPNPSKSIRNGKKCLSSIPSDKIAPMSPLTDLSLSELGVPSNVRNNDSADAQLFPENERPNPKTKLRRQNSADGRRLSAPVSVSGSGGVDDDNNDGEGFEDEPTSRRVSTGSVRKDKLRPSTKEGSREMSTTHNAATTIKHSRSRSDSSQHREKSSSQRREKTTSTKKMLASQQLSNKKIVSRSNSAVSDSQQQQHNQQQQQQTQPQHQQSNSTHTAVFVHGQPEDTSWSTQVGLQWDEMLQRYGSSRSISPARSSSTTKVDVMRIRVLVRKRPMSRKESSSGDVDIIQCVDSCRNDDSSSDFFGRVLVHQPKTRVDLTREIDTLKFCFDDVFDETSSNAGIYAQSVKSLIPGVLEGRWGSVFAYGQTGSGKTFTMMGSGATGHKSKSNVEKNHGLYYLAAQDLFRRLKEHSNKYRHLRVGLSLFEIYGGKLFDLLSKPGRRPVKCLEDHQNKVRFPGLTEHPISSPDQLLEKIEFGNSHRSTGTTSANADSSRSHAVLMLSLRGSAGSKNAMADRRQQQRSLGRRSLSSSHDSTKNNNVEHGRLTFVDLAGSERGADTANACRTTRLEGAEINTSLLALKEVIRALATGLDSDSMKKHIPFRGSKLTQVLKESFVGDNSRTVMVACVAPNMANCEHTVNTLRYADRVKERDAETGRDPHYQNQNTELTVTTTPHSIKAKTNTNAEEPSWSSEDEEEEEEPEQPERLRVERHNDVLDNDDDDSDYIDDEEEEEDDYYDDDDDDYVEEEEEDEYYEDYDDYVHDQPAVETRRDPHPNTKNLNVEAVKHRYKNDKNSRTTTTIRRRHADHPTLPGNKSATTSTNNNNNNRADTPLEEASQHLITTHRNMMTTMLNTVKHEMSLVNNTDTDRNKLEDYLIELDHVMENNKSMVGTLHEALSEYEALRNAPNQHSRVKGNVQGQLYPGMSEEEIVGNVIDDDEDEDGLSDDMFEDLRD